MPTRPMTSRPDKSGHGQRTWMERWLGRAVVSLLCALGVVLLGVGFFTKGIALRLSAVLLLVLGMVFACMGARIAARLDKWQASSTPVELLPVRVRDKYVSSAIHMNSDSTVRSHTDTFHIAFEHLDTHEQYEFAVRQAQYDHVEESETGLLHIKDGQYVGFERV